MKLSSTCAECKLKQIRKWNGTFKRKNNNKKKFFYMSQVDTLTISNRQVEIWRMKEWEDRAFRLNSYWGILCVHNIVIDWIKQLIK
jgi:hypothetical protein